MKTQINDLLQKKMDRRDFLKVVGLGLLAAVGFVGLMKLLAPNTVEKHLGALQKDDSYGGMTYGGSKR